MSHNVTVINKMIIRIKQRDTYLYKIYIDFLIRFHNGKSLKQAVNVGKSE